MENQGSVKVQKRFIKGSTKVQQRFNKGSEKGQKRYNKGSWYLQSLYQIHKLHSCLYLSTIFSEVSHVRKCNILSDSGFQSTHQNHQGQNWPTMYLGTSFRVVLWIFYRYLQFSFHMVSTLQLHFGHLLDAFGNCKKRDLKKLWNAQGQDSAMTTSMDVFFGARLKSKKGLLFAEPLLNLSRTLVEPNLNPSSTLVESLSNLCWTYVEP